MDGITRTRNHRRSNSKVITTNHTDIHITGYGITRITRFRIGDDFDVETIQCGGTDTKPIVV